MVRRLKKEYGDDKQTDFAPFIERQYNLIVFVLRNGVPYLLCLLYMICVHPFTVDLVTANKLHLTLFLECLVFIFPTPLAW